METMIGSKSVSIGTRAPKRMAKTRHPAYAIGSFAFGAILIAAALGWIASAYLGPAQTLEGTVDIAVDGSTVGGTGVRGGDRALDVLLIEKLSGTAYQPTFRLSLGLRLFGAESAYRLGQRMPRGTSVTLRFSADDLQEALAYAEVRQHADEAGEPAPITMLSPGSFISIVSSLRKTVWWSERTGRALPCGFGWLPWP